MMDDINTPVEEEKGDMEQQRGGGEGGGGGVGGMTDKREMDYATA